MNTVVACLTPAGTGALATLALQGPHAWAIVHALFRPARGTLAAEPSVGRPRFGTFGTGTGDEVILCVTDATPTIEIHCHGGRQVVEWLLELCVQHGATRVPWTDLPTLPRWQTTVLERLNHAPTTRTASILLDQYHGAEQLLLRRLAVALATEQHEAAGALLAELARWTDLTRFLTDSIRVVVAGPPNVGKSSFINAVAGYQRSIVSATPGTTRDVVTALVALDGWAVELADTAGLRTTADALEAAGTEQARSVLASADVVLWLLDRSTVAVSPDALAQAQLDERARCGRPTLRVATKADLPAAWDVPADVPQVSAPTGQGIAELARQLPALVIPAVPAPGAAVPTTVARAEQVRQMWAAWQRNDRASVQRTLSDWQADPMI